MFVIGVVDVLLNNHLIGLEILVIRQEHEVDAPFDHAGLLPVFEGGELLVVFELIRANLLSLALHLRIQVNELRLHNRLYRIVLRFFTEISTDYDGNVLIIVLKEFAKLKALADARIHEFRFGFQMRLTKDKLLGGVLHATH